MGSVSIVDRIAYPQWTYNPGFTVNAGSYGMSPGSTGAQNAAALQAAIDVVAPLKGRVLIPFALSAYTIGAITIGTEGQRYTAEIVGESWCGDIGQSDVGGVTLKLADGTDDNMFTVASTAAPIRLENLNLQGNKANQTGITQGGGDKSYGVYFTDYTTDSTKQRSGLIERCRIEGFASGGIYAGLLRNAGHLVQVTILNSGTKESGTAQTGSATPDITLATGASAVDDTYNGMYILITGGTGVGQLRTISDYVGATRIATVDSAWGTTPDNTSTYSIGLVLADGIVLASNNDWRIERCDIGGNTRNGIYNTGGGSVTYVATNSFTNWQNGWQADNTALDMQWIGGSIDTNYQYGAHSRGSSSSLYNRTFSCVRFNQNGIGKHNTYSDVKATNDDGVNIADCTFLKGSAAATNSRYPKYSIETAGTTTKINVTNFIYDAATEPWTTSRFNDQSMVRGLCETGIYTPTYTNVANIAAKTTSDLQWVRNGNYVRIWGRILIDPTAAAPTATQVDISLPTGLTSNFTVSEDVSGVANSGQATAAQEGTIVADTSNDRLSLVYKATDAANASLYFEVNYKLK